MTTTIRRTAVMLAGLTLATGAVLGVANPASADTAKGNNTNQSQTVRGAHGHGWGGWDDNDWEFRGLYNSRWACEREGQWQTRRSHDDYVCVRSNHWRRNWDRDDRRGDSRRNWDRWGHRNGAFALYVRD